MEIIQQTKNWKEVLVRGFIAFNEEGLRELIGEPIASALMTTYMQKRIYAGMIDGRHEFVEQHHFFDQLSKRFYFTKNISGLRSLVKLDFRDEGINISSFQSRIYTPGSKEYEERRAWLQEWNMWKDIH